MTGRNEYQKRYYKDHPEYREAVRKRVAEHQKENPEYWRESNRRSWHKLRREAIAAYGGVCQCCGEAEYRFLTIDHIDGNGAEERRSASSTRGNNQGVLRRLRREGWPPGYQTLCWNCNCARQFNNGVCPHVHVYPLQLQLDPPGGPPYLCRGGPPEGPVTQRRNGSRWQIS